jgi:hypothetical protein
MPKLAPASVGGVVHMTQEERSKHIAYYREQMQELQQMGQWIGPSEAEARASMSTRLIALERTVALLEDTDA